MEVVVLLGASLLNLPDFGGIADFEPAATLRTVRAIRIDVQIPFRRRAKKYT
jgi:hypothetical protein